MHSVQSTLENNNTIPFYAELWTYRALRQRVVQFQFESSDLMKWFTLHTRTQAHLVRHEMTMFVFCCFVFLLLFKKYNVSLIILS